MSVEYKVLMAGVTGLVISIAIVLGRPAQAIESSLVGIWKLVSFVSEDVQTKERKSQYGEHPNGYAVITPEGRLMVIITAEGRKVPLTAEDRDTARGSGAIKRDSLGSKVTSYTSRPRQLPISTSAVG